MSEDAKYLLKKYGLRCISTMVYEDRVTVYLHRYRDTGEDDCVSGYGSSFSEAFENARLEYDRFGSPARSKIPEGKCDGQRCYYLGCQGEEECKMVSA